MGMTDSFIKTLDQYFFINLRTKEYGKLARNAGYFFKTMLLGYPQMIMIELCNTCNIDCPLCTWPPELNERTKRMMSYDEFVKIINNIEPITYRILLGSSGEPLLNKDIFRMISYATKNKIYIMLSTNGTLLNKNNIMDLFGSGLDRLLISLDGISKNSYEKMRKGADFDKVIENIKNLCDYKRNYKKHKPVIAINYIITRYNESEIQQAREETRRWGVDAFFLRKLTLPEHLVNQEELKSFKENYLPLNNNYRKKRYSGKHNEPQICKHHTNCSVILADGSVTICCSDFKGKYSIGNAIVDDFKKLWFSKKYENLRNKGHNKQLLICKNCFPDD